MLDGAYTDCGSSSLNGLFPGAGPAAPCPNNTCYGWSADGRPTYFFASVNGPGSYYDYSGPGALYYSPSQAGAAAGAFFLGLSESIGREIGGTISQDSNGVFTYAWTATGIPCAPGVDCESTINADPSTDQAIWHTHVVPQDIIQFFGDRTANVPIPDYITTPIGSSFGTFQVGPWNGGVQGQYPPTPEQLDYPQIAPICRVSGAAFPGISSCN